MDQKEPPEAPHELEEHVPEKEVVEQVAPYEEQEVAPQTPHEGGGEERTALGRWGSPSEHVVTVQGTQKDNARREETWESLTEGKTWKHPNPAPQESPHGTKNPAAQRYHPEKTPQMWWHAGL